jgi:histidine triad (HIT) family protein
MNADCLFCSIANGDAEKLVWHNDDVAAFRDIHPKAKVHVLVVPKKHVTNLDDLEDPELASKLVMALREVAKQEGVKDGWRVQVNNGVRGGQAVFHLHFHLLGSSSGENLPSAVAL